MSALRRSPLYDRHVALGAKLADFGGWEMPIEYAASGGGVLREHAAVREAVGIFDVSHLGKATVRGPGARAYVNATLSNDLDRIGPGQAQYTLCCDGSGGVVDDLIVYLVSDDEVFLVPNAANTAEVVRRLVADAPDGVTVTGQHEDFGVLAVQGPRSAEVLDRLGLPSALDYMAYADAELDGRPVRVCRTGYTGEHGYELLPRWADAPAVWDALRDASADLGGIPAGLGARDTLRTEMGYPLHGQDLSLEITPVQARSGWAVGWSKPRFWGRDALLAEKAAGPQRVLWGLTALDRGIPRAHMAVLAPSGDHVGEVTSGTFSPTLKQGIALALLDTAAGIGEGDELTIDVRGRTSQSASASTSASASASTAWSGGGATVAIGARNACTVVLTNAVSGTAIRAPGMPASNVPVSTDSAIASGCTSTLRLMMSGCSRCASSCSSTTIATATTIAAVSPCSSPAITTHSAPAMVRPSSGMNEPRKISTPSAGASGTRSTTSTIATEMPWNSAISSWPRM
jgi:aminomethyltransferase